MTEKIYEIIEAEKQVWAWQLAQKLNMQILDLTNLLNSHPNKFVGRNGRWSLVGAEE